MNHEIGRILSLSKNEKAILAVIPPDGCGLSQLATLVKIPRTTLPDTIKKLKKRGFIVVMKKGRRNQYINTSTKVLNDIGLIVGDRSDSIPRRSPITIHRGKKALIAILDSFISMHPGTRISGLQPYRSLKKAYEKIPLRKILDFNEAIKSRRLIIEGIVHEKSIPTTFKHYGPHAKKVLNSFVGRLEDYVKIPDEFADVQAEIYILRNAAYIINWNIETAIEVNDSDTVNLFKAMFDCVKLIGTRYHQGKDMQRFLPK